MSAKRRHSKFRRKPPVVQCSVACTRQGTEFGTSGRRSRSSLSVLPARRDHRCARAGAHQQLGGALGGHLSGVPARVLPWASARHSPTNIAPPPPPPSPECRGKQRIQHPLQSLNRHTQPEKPIRLLGEPLVSWLLHVAWRAPPLLLVMVVSRAFLFRVFTLDLGWAHKYFDNGTGRDREPRGGLGQEAVQVDLYSSSNAKKQRGTEKDRQTDRQTVGESGRRQRNRGGGGERHSS